MGPFHHIQRQGQHKLHSDHASFCLHLPKNKEKYFTYKMGTILTIWQAILLLCLFIPMISNGTCSLKWGHGACIFHSPKASATNTDKGFHLCTQISTSAPCCSSDHDCQDSNISPRSPDLLYSYNRMYVLIVIWQSWVSWLFKSPVTK